MLQGTWRPYKDQPTGLQRWGHKGWSHLSELALGLDSISPSWVWRLHPFSPMLAAPYRATQGSWWGAQALISPLMVWSLCWMSTTTMSRFGCLESGTFPIMNGWQGNSVRLGVHLSRHLQILVASFQKSSHQTMLLNWSMTTCMMHCRSSLKQGWPTWRLVLMRRHTLIISMWHERLRRKRQWNPLIARLQTVQASLRQWASSLYESWQALRLPRPLLWGSTPAGGECQQRRGNESKDPNGINGITDEFIVHLARAVKDAQQKQKFCYHCSSPEHFIRDCPLVKAPRMNLHLNWKEGTAPKKGVQAPQGKVVTLKLLQDGMPKA